MGRLPWRLWWRQARTVAGPEAARSLFGRRSLGLWVLAALPVALAALRLAFLPARHRLDPGLTTTELAQLYHIFLLRFVVFFGAAQLFIGLYRREILERSLHYTLLAPLRREVMVAGKYLGGLAAALAVLLPATAATFLLMYAPHLGLGVSAVLTGKVLGQLASYLGVAAAGCVAYGALFLLVGLSFRNPMVPALCFFGWEVATPFLPPLLKALSVIHYLTSLTPVPPALGPLAMLAEPVAPLLAIGALLAASGALLAASAWRARRLEVGYASD
jgi:hypothetical protein